MQMNEVNELLVWIEIANGELNILQLLTQAFTTLVTHVKGAKLRHETGIKAPLNT